MSLKYTAWMGVRKGHVWCIVCGQLELVSYGCDPTKGRWDGVWGL